MKESILKQQIVVVLLLLIDVSVGLMFVLLFTCMGTYYSPYFHGSACLNFNSYIPSYYTNFHFLLHFTHLLLLICEEQHFGSPSFTQGVFVTKDRFLSLFCGI
eukprot:TRINITY_DN1966_c0_g1_i4.p1 TRINITY_DN1966_c0_g1~~TRINITY_DN1966_c0_g1_i4.p1  ORF type:complete len:103 (-),score=8.94 TRINITY_DN1966_c0_g1_i4:58-366(-)